MTKPLDPEIKALRAMVRALNTLDPAAQERTVDWLHARTHNTTQASPARRSRRHEP